MRTMEVGQKLPSLVMLIKYDSQCTPRFLFWNNKEGTDPADLSEVVDLFVEVTVDGDTTITWQGSYTDNAVSIELAPADTLVDWDTKPFNLIFMKPSRTAVLSGEIQVQR